LFSDFEINYNTIEEIYRRGTLLYLVDEEVELEKKETVKEKLELEEKSDSK
jgi:tRNA(His) 5'-end guanylyltransferase